MSKRNTKIPQQHDQYEEANKKNDSHFGRANAVAQGAFRKTITASDVYKALETINLGSFVATVKEQVDSECETYSSPLFWLKLC